MKPLTELELLSDDSFLELLEVGPSVREWSDEELKYTCDRLGTIGGHQDDMGECFDELWRRYEELRRIAEKYVDLSK